MTSEIKKLPEELIIKICAGEVINSPLNLIKECLENSIDANSSSIRVVLEKGGLNKILIEDNGFGIDKKSLAISCDRFTTSKLSSLSTLKSLVTFGFRGEALFSISQISHLTITSKSMSSDKAYKLTHFPSKKLEEAHRETGTTILSQNIFYNFPLRRETIKPSQIAKAVSDLIFSFSLNFPTKTFNYISKAPDIHFSSANIDNRISILQNYFDPSISKFLIEFEVVSRYFELCNVLCTTPFYNSKKDFTCIIFINNRLVLFPALKKAVKAIYSEFCAKKVSSFFFISLKIRTTRIDANVHPAKENVELQDNLEIIKAIKENLNLRLKKSSEIKPFYNPTITSFSSKPKSNTQNIDSLNSSNISNTGNLSNIGSSSNLSNFSFGNIKTGSEISTTSFVPRSVSGNSVNEIFKVRKSPPNLKNFIFNSKIQEENLQTKKTKILQEAAQNINKKIVPKTNFESLFQKIEFVGYFDKKRILVSIETELIALNIINLMKDILKQWFFKRKKMHEFGNLEFLQKEILLKNEFHKFLSLEESHYKDGEDEPKEVIIDLLFEVLENYKTLLKDFGILFENGKIKEWPKEFKSLVKNEKIFRLIFDIAVVLTDGGKEKDIRNSIVCEICKFYCNGLEDLYEEDIEKANGFVEGVVLPILKGEIKEVEFKVRDDIIDDGTMRRITNVKKLFKAFDRV